MFTSRSNAQSNRTTYGDDVPVTVYGTNWCGQTMMVRRLLEKFGVPYRYVDIERNPDAANQIRWWTGGYVSHPTVYIGGEILVEPTVRELQGSLAQKGLV